MMRTGTLKLAGALFLFTALTGGAFEVEQVFREERFSRGDVNLRVLQEIDKAAWIWMDGSVRLADPAHPMVRFRRDFKACGAPLRIDVSADARFVLLLDGEIVARGPHKGFVDHWYYETYDIRGLGQGDHRLEAVVFDLGDAGPVGIMTSGRSGFILKASEPYDAALTTGKAEWSASEIRCMRYGKLTDPETMVMVENIVSGTGFLDWSDFDWHPTAVVKPPVEDRGYGYHLPSWALFPTERPDPISAICAPGRVRASQFAYDQTNVCYTAEDGDRDWTRRFDALVRRGEAVTVPANTEIRFLWDFGDYYCGYPILETAGGRGAKIRWAWAESLYRFRMEGDIHANRGHRDEFAGKVNRRSMYDTFLPDGRPRAKFTVPWWKSGRWVELSVKTVDEPVTLTRMAIDESRYPLEVESSFSCDDASVSPIRRMCVRGVQNCLHETFMDCPYFEQQMYPGDTRVVMLVLSTLTRDARLTRHGIGIFDYARRDDGLVPMSFPNRGNQDSSTYSMCWTLMLGDYARWHGADAFLRARIPGARQTLSALAAHRDGRGLVADLSGWSFMDWVPEWGTYGIAPDGRRGVSAVNNLLYVLALQSVAHAERATGDAAMSDYWTAQAEQTAQAIVGTFWSEERGMLADTVRKDLYSEHAQCLALLADILPADKAKRSFAGLVSEKDLARTTVYFSHYLFETYLKFGRADLFLKRLDLWRGFVAEGLKTPLEAPGWRGRSECHAWGAHPLYHLQTGVAGIKPAADGFASVKIAPQPGGLSFVRATSPTPKGPVTVDLRFEDEKVSGRVEIPEGLPGLFEWKGASTALKPGVNPIEMDGVCAGMLPADRVGWEKIRRGISMDRGDGDDSDIRRDFTELADGTRVWNEWSEDGDRRYRLEIAERADGALEVTMNSEVSAGVTGPRRLIVRIPPELTGGEAPKGEVRGKWFAAGGLTYDMHPVGEGDYWGAQQQYDGDAHCDSVRGHGVVSPTSDGGMVIVMGDGIKGPWGGYLGAKLVIRRGTDADFGKIHFLDQYSYMQSMKAKHLLSFAARKRGACYQEGDHPFDGACGWQVPPEHPRKLVGAASGAYYSALSGTGEAVYRFAGLVDGWYFLTFAAGNYTGASNRFTVSAAGEALFENATVAERDLRRVVRPVHVKGGVLDVTFSGDWLVSTLALQPFMTDQEDFSVSRSFWVVDGYEPASLYRNRDTPRNFRPKTADTTERMPVPGTEFAGARKTMPAEIALPDPDRPEVAWIKTCKIKRLFDNGAAFGTLPTEKIRAGLLKRDFADEGVTAVLLSGLLARHCYGSRGDEAVEEIGKIVRTAHAMGMKVIDHIDLTLTWNNGYGFRWMMEHTDELLRSFDGDLVSYQRCAANPALAESCYPYFHRLAEKGVDAFQVDELYLWPNGCTCAHCRERFRRDVGWDVPLDETNPAWNDHRSPFYRAWLDWRGKTCTSWLVGLRKNLADVNDHLALSAYPTYDSGLISPWTSRLGQNFRELTRVINFFGLECMSRNFMRNVREEFPAARLMDVWCEPHGASRWQWYYNGNVTNDYVCWAASRMTGSQPLLSPSFVHPKETGKSVPIAEVGLYYSVKTRDYDDVCRRWSKRLFATAQELERMHVPYSFVADFSVSPERLSRYKVLYLTGLEEPFDDTEKAAFAAFERGGGRIVRGEARDEAFEVPGYYTWGPYGYKPDPAGERSFRARLAEKFAGATWWEIDAPDMVFTSVRRGEDGACEVRLLNMTGVVNVPGAAPTPDAPVPPFPALERDVVFTLPRGEGLQAVATSPDFEGKRTLKTSVGADGRVSVVVPKDLLGAYVLVRVTKGEDAWAKYLTPPARYGRFARKVEKVSVKRLPDFDVEVYDQANGPGTHQRVMMAVPKDAKGRLPAVVVPFYFPEAMLGFDLSSQTNLPFWSGISFMTDLARRGYVTISAEAYHLTYDRNLKVKDEWSRWQPTGEKFNREWPDWTGIGKLTFDTRLLVDMLAADPRVDGSRIGIIGHSLGGKMAFYAGCLDPRIRVIVASDFGIGWDQTNWKDPWYWGDRLAAARAEGLDHAGLLSLAGGKPFCLLAGQYDDASSGDLMRQAVGYDGHAERLKLVNHATGHRPPPGAVETGYAFLDLYLKK